MLRSIVRMAALGALCAGALLPLPAAAEGWNGACLVNIRVDFSPPITISPGGTTFSLSGSGTCPVSSLTVPVATRTITMVGSGSSGSGRCAPLLLSGSFVLNFSTGSPPGANGIFSMNGTASGGSWVMNGTNFTGAGIAAGTGLVDCASGGASSLNFQVLFGFLDP